jgi:rhodanese-related sulfurtransferase
VTRQKELAMIARLSLFFATLLLAQAAAADGPAVKADDLIAAQKAGEKVLVLDVRTEAEYAKGHVPGALNIPHDVLPARLSEVKDRRPDRVVVYCESGRRAGMAEETLREAGVENVELLEGHMKEWRTRELPQE